MPDGATARPGPSVARPAPEPPFRPPLPLQIRGHDGVWPLGVPNSLRATPALCSARLAFARSVRRRRLFSVLGSERCELLLELRDAGRPHPLDAEAGLPQPLEATRYHSLVVDRASVPDCLEITAETDNGIVMGLRHRDLAVEGVQFHPESILTVGGHDLLRNFLRQAAGAPVS